MIKTGSMTNPKCQKCPDRDTCKNKTLCAYLYDDGIIPLAIPEDELNEVLAPIILTPEMIQRKMIEDAVSISMGIDNASLMGMRSD